MSSTSTGPRRCPAPAGSTPSGRIIIPFPHDVDLAPQLVVVALARAALVAAHRALGSAHPVLGMTRLGCNPPLTDTEGLAAAVLISSNELALLMADYEAAILHHIHALDDLPFPF